MRLPNYCPCSYLGANIGCSYVASDFQFQSSTSSGAGQMSETAEYFVIKNPSLMVALHGKIFMSMVRKKYRQQKLQKF